MTRKICVENATKLKAKIEKLEKELKELKEKGKPSNAEKDLPYPCDKCDDTYKTAGLLIKHVKDVHTNLLAYRP